MSKASPLPKSQATGLTTGVPVSVAYVCHNVNTKAAALPIANRHNSTILAAPQLAPLTSHVPLLSAPFNPSSVPSRQIRPAQGPAILLPTDQNSTSVTATTTGASPPLAPLVSAHQNPSSLPVPTVQASQSSGLIVSNRQQPTSLPAPSMQPLPPSTPPVRAVPNTTLCAPSAQASLSTPPVRAVPSTTSFVARDHDATSLPASSVQAVQTPVPAVSGIQNPSAPRTSTSVCALPIAATPSPATPVQTNRQHNPNFPNLSAPLFVLPAKAGSSPSNMSLPMQTHPIPTNNSTPPDSQSVPSSHPPNNHLPSVHTPRVMHSQNPRSEPHQIAPAGSNAAPSNHISNLPIRPPGSSQSPVDNSISRADVNQPMVAVQGNGSLPNMTLSCPGPVSHFRPTPNMPIVSLQPNISCPAPVQSGVPVQPQPAALASLQVLQPSYGTSCQTKHSPTRSGQEAVSRSNFARPRASITKSSHLKPIRSSPVPGSSKLYAALQNVNPSLGHPVQCGIRSTNADSINLIPTTPYQTEVQETVSSIPVVDTRVDNRIVPHSNGGRDGLQHPNASGGGDGTSSHGSGIGNNSVDANLQQKSSGLLTSSAHPKADRIISFHPRGVPHGTSHQNMVSPSANGPNLGSCHSLPSNTNIVPIHGGNPHAAPTNAVVPMCSNSFQKSLCNGSPSSNFSKKIHLNCSYPSSSQPNAISQNSGLNKMSVAHHINANKTIGGLSSTISQNACKSSPHVVSNISIAGGISILPLRSPISGASNRSILNPIKSIVPQTMAYDLNSQPRSMEIDTHAPKHVAPILHYPKQISSLEEGQCPPVKAVMSQRLEKHPANAFPSNPAVSGHAPPATQSALCNASFPKTDFNLSNSAVKKEPDGFHTNLCVESLIAPRNVLEPSLKPCDYVSHSQEVKLGLSLPIPSSQASNIQYTVKAHQNMAPLMSEPSPTVDSQQHRVVSTKPPVDGSYKLACSVPQNLVQAVPKSQSTVRQGGNNVIPKLLPAAAVYQQVSASAPPMSQRAAVSSDQVVLLGLAPGNCPIPEHSQGRNDRMQCLNDASKGKNAISSECGSHPVPSGQQIYQSLPNSGKKVPSPMANLPSIPFLAVEGTPACSQPALSSVPHQGHEKAANMGEMCTLPSERINDSKKVETGDLSSKPLTVLVKSRESAMKNGNALRDDDGDSQMKDKLEKPLAGASNMVCTAMGNSIATDALNAKQETPLKFSPFPSSGLPKVVPQAQTLKSKQTAEGLAKPSQCPGVSPKVDNPEVKLVQGDNQISCSSGKSKREPSDAVQSLEAQNFKLKLEYPESDDTKGNKDKIGKKRSKKVSHKRKIDHISHMTFDQDDNGRLTKSIVFPDSQTPISLGAYKKSAKSHHEHTRQMLLKEERDSSNTRGDGETTDCMKNVDRLEEVFWKAMSDGLDGKPLTVAYGVDVEAEGAFDSAGMSYVEWNGAQPSSSGRSKKKRSYGGTSGKRKVKHESLILESEGNKQGRRNSGSVDDEVLDGGNERAELPKKVRARSSESMPNSHVGNLNRNGLLRHMPVMPGINHSMFYIGQLFTRFCWHTEDAFLNSVSYLHEGSAEKVWYAVPPEFATAFEEYAKANVFSTSLLETVVGSQVLLMNKTTMFDPKEVQRNGVRVFRVVHKPGSFVLTAPRAYHAGFNCGFNIAEAVNFANPTWFPVGREASIFARKVARPLCVPWEYLLFHEAKAMRRDVVSASGKRKITQRMKQNAEVVARELEVVMREGEDKIRQYAEIKNCRVSMVNEVDMLVKHNQLGPEFGHGAGMVCSVCGHACHFYAEICGSCDDSFEARCVQHFGKGHQLCLIAGHKTIVVRRHDPVLLLDILGCLENLADIKQDPVVKMQRYEGYIRPWQTPVRSSGLRLRMNLKLAASRLPPKITGEKRTRDSSRREKPKRSRQRAAIQDVDCDSEDEILPKRRRRVERKKSDPKESGRKVDERQKEKVGIGDGGNDEDWLDIPKSKEAKVISLL